jgi:DGQHR domain-containing protein
MTQTKKQKNVSMPFEQNIVKLCAIKSKALDVDCYRGFAKLSELSRISCSDEYNEVSHPDGIQRDLNKTHAREAYEYAANKIAGTKRIWPEVILSKRYDNGVSVKSYSTWKGAEDIFPVCMKIDLTKITLNSTDPTFSRVDGNHRLHYARGIDKKHPPIDSIVPFCIIEEISRDEEVVIFRTINEEQKRLRTDHLLRITEQVTKGIDLMKKNPVLWLSKRLREEPASPFYQLVHIAGPKVKGESYLINQKSLHDGVKVLFKSLDINLKSGNNLKDLPEVIIRYFSAVSKRWPNEWKDSKKYLLMTNTGMQAMGSVGAQLIERQVKTAKLSEDDFLNELKSVAFSWEQGEGEQKLPTGRSGGEIIAKQILQSMASTTVDLSKIL